MPHEPNEHFEWGECIHCTESFIGGYDYYDTIAGKVHEECLDDWMRKHLEVKLIVGGAE